MSNCFIELRWEGLHLVQVCDQVAGSRGHLGLDQGTHFQRANTPECALCARGRGGFDAFMPSCSLRGPTGVVEPYF